jgi:hypothetical protein
MSVGLDPNVAANSTPQELTQPLYDTAIYALAGGFAVLPLFAQGLGSGTSAFGGAGTKTEADTNLPPNGQLPTGWKHEAKAVSLVAWSTAATQAADTQIAIGGGVFRYEISTTRWFTVPMRRLTGGCGVSSANTTIGHIGDAQADKVYPLAIHLITVGGMSISAGFFWPGAGGSLATTANVPLSLFLEGDFYRRV